VCAGHIRLNKVRVVREEEEALRKNYASMDLTIQQIDVKLSLWWCVVLHIRVTSLPGLLFYHLFHFIFRVWSPGSWRATVCSRR